MHDINTLILPAGTEWILLYLHFDMSTRMRQVWLMSWTGTLLEKGEALVYNLELLDWVHSREEQMPLYLQNLTVKS